MSPDPPAPICVGRLGTRVWTPSVRRRGGLVVSVVVVALRLSVVRRGRGGRGGCGGAIGAIVLGEGLVEFLV